MRRVSVKFVTRLLTDYKKGNRVVICQELLVNANGNKNTLKNIVVDDTWVYGYGVETKMQSSLWMGKGFPRKKKDESIKVQGDVGCDFWLEMHCPSRT
jgi:hypothetical protein